ncbi:MAG TPA: ribokinase, partial [Erysipelotrichaceae bacterium]|nr:ribokinase [Erysipelotrichaceae bacterium]
MRKEKDVGIMKVLCFGSMNIDESYLMDHFVRPGETQSALTCTRSLGGKGFNQALAIAKAGGEVIMAGCIGSDGYAFKEALEQYDCTTQFIKEVNQPTGHAFIQVADGENAIVLNSGANYAIDDAFIDEVLSVMHAGDMILLQNEINAIDKIIKKAHERKLKIILNAAPMSEAVNHYPLEYIDLLIVNVSEAQQLAKCMTSNLEELMEALENKFSNHDILLTVGKQGSYYLSEGKRKYVGAFACHVVDTTGAGDTYIGYFLACIMANKSIEEAMQIASFAA